MADDCRSSGAAIGELHEPFCNRELCPFCCDFIATCKCIFRFSNFRRRNAKLWTHSRMTPLTRSDPFATVGRQQRTPRGEFHTTIEHELRRTKP